MKSSFSSQIIAVGLVMASVMAPATAAFARGGGQCMATVEAALDKYNIDKSTVEKVSFTTIMNGGGRGGGGYIETRKGWVRFNHCKGSLVVKMSPNCDFEEVYTQYGCTFPGIKHY